MEESFFQSLKRERIRRQTYKIHKDAWQAVFDYIDMFYNPLRKHFQERDARTGRVRNSADVEKRKVSRKLGATQRVGLHQP